MIKYNKDIFDFVKKIDFVYCTYDNYNFVVIYFRYNDIVKPKANILSLLNDI